jgi:hypothetical protein
MSLYSYKQQYPTSLPFRITLSDGRTRTDPSSFTQGELLDAGYTLVEDQPSYTSNQVLDWNSVGNSWTVRDKTEEELQAEANLHWTSIRQERDNKIQQVVWRYERYARYERLGIAQVDSIQALDNYIQILADLPETQIDPFTIIWPNLEETTNGN